MTMKRPKGGIGSIDVILSGNSRETGIILLFFMDHLFHFCKEK